MRADRVIEQSPRLRARVRGQSGLITRTQALDAGIGIEAVRWALASGRWTAPHPGVYLTTPGRDDWEVRAVATMLPVGGLVALTGASARFAWGLERRLPQKTHVIVPAGRRAPVRGDLTVTRSRRFDEWIHPTAWPHRTTVEHSVLHVEKGQPFERVLSLVARACQQGLTSEQRLVEALAARQGQPFGALLRECLSDVGAGAESAAEIRYIRDVERAHGLPRAIRQAVLAQARRCDNLYEEHGLVLEVDGRVGHEGWAGRVRDGARDRAAAREGRLTVRGYWTDVASTPCAFADEVGSLLQMRGWVGSPRPCRRRDCFLRAPRAA
ncbi:type IV toxin-antitoxin system AbiEi family antitoxin domain-containing protein [Intrasporangium flavum]|uniref:type IV toxin-antitoxin system AbiEi family antitoxin domain-containing protein n=1 Tax=Intrasporangium flavum TaxID=1428657 RepID=UPI00096EE398|nr:type IV toxin-antitoxin system AbiEi family antitoxin domain-containing protein [Intrasporangium flavum]